MKIKDIFLSQPSKQVKVSASQVLSGAACVDLVILNASLLP